jgi:hypothetical protein
MKLNARNYLSLAEVVFLESSGAPNATKTALASTGNFSVTKHLKVVLKHVNKLIRLKRLFDLRRHLVYELV